MNYLLTALLFLGFTIAPLQSRAAAESSPRDDRGPAEPRQLAEAAMKFVAREDMKGLFKYLGTIMPMPQGELDSLRDNIIGQRKQIGGKIGAQVGYAFISECRKSETLARLIYVEKRAKNVMRWMFIFYKPRDRWQLSYFYWDEKLPEIFEPC